VEKPQDIDSEKPPGSTAFNTLAIMGGLVGVALLINAFDGDITRNLIPVLALCSLGGAAKLIRTFREEDPEVRDYKE